MAAPRSYRQFTETATTALDNEGFDAEPFLGGCPQQTARLIFDEIAEAMPGRPRESDVASITTAVRDFTLPYTSHRREAARRALHAR
ncbi:hypothetical protein [Streptomyces sp. NPDC058145]|uniref:hypothetical protein n=1 Tax=Streptomyces sp. NPDC058145 TaxID=3346356 RepID=UPI0036E1216F